MVNDRYEQMSRAWEAQQAAFQYCTFQVDDLFFGIDVRRVQEVLRAQEVTPIPRAPAVMEGLINLRGQIVQAVDMRRRLGLPPRPEGVHPMNMIVHTEEGAASLLVDEVGDVLDVEGESFEPVPENLGAQAQDLIQGVCKLNDRLLLVLNTDRALEFGGAASAESAR